MMRIFHELLVDAYIADLLTHFSDTHWVATMGNMETFKTMVVADRVSGSASLTVGFLETPDITFKTKNIGSMILNAPLVAGQTNVFSGFSTPAVPPSHGLWLTYALTGTSPAAHLRIWVTGRGKA